MEGYARRQRREVQQPEAAHRLFHGTPRQEAHRNGQYGRQERRAAGSQ